MADHTSESCIPRHPHSRRACILAGDTLIADTRNAIELRERGYSSRKCLTQADMKFSKLSVLATEAYYAFKTKMPLLIFLYCRELSTSKR
ncbi:hypothetical protein ACGTNG_02480 [Halomonas sp. 1390]|uniref:hypothetical protein n=1 Tax=Halomonas sp. B23F22_3 TaxID=3459516 RepID=UPI00373EE58D